MKVESRVQKVRWERVQRKNQQREQTVLSKGWTVMAKRKIEWYLEGAAGSKQLFKSVDSYFCRLKGKKNEVSEKPGGGKK